MYHRQGRKIKHQMTSLPQSTNLFIKQSARGSICYSHVAVEQLTATQQQVYYDDDQTTQNQLNNLSVLK